MILSLVATNYFRITDDGRVRSDPSSVETRTVQSYLQNLELNL